MRRPGEVRRKAADPLTISAVGQTIVFCGLSGCGAAVPALAFCGADAHVCKRPPGRPCLPSDRLWCAKRPGLRLFVRLCPPPTIRDEAGEMSFRLYKCPLLRKKLKFKWPKSSRRRSSRHTVPYAPLRATPSLPSPLPTWHNEASFLYGGSLCGTRRASFS